VGLSDKMDDKMQQLEGDAKEKVGDAIDDEHMQAEGKADSAAGNLKQAGEKVKDAF
jgi:uncharacterized protein YjbJ (UPF0337 family)